MSRPRRCYAVDWHGRVCFHGGRPAGEIGRMDLCLPYRIAFRTKFDGETDIRCTPGHIFVTVAVPPAITV
jgi:hypothetical protein